MLRVPGLAVAAFCLHATVAQADCHAERDAQVPITIAHGYVFLPVKMNGEAGNFLLDTGSAETLVDSAFASRAGAGMDRVAGQFIYQGAGNKETLPGFHGHVRITEVGEIRFQDWEYGMVDMNSLSSAEDRQDGILGMDFLHHFQIEIDFTSRTLTLYRLHGCGDISPPWKKDYDAIPLTRTVSQNVTLPVFVNDTILHVEFDTGAGDHVLLTRDAAAKAGVSRAALAKDLAGKATGIGGEFHVAAHRFSLFLVGSAVYKDHLLGIENEYSERNETDGLMGLGPLNADRIWLSFSTNTLFVQRASQIKPGQ